MPFGRTAGKRWFDVLSDNCYKKGDASLGQILVFDLLLLSFLFLLSNVHAAEIATLGVDIRTEEIYVSISLTLDEKFITEAKNGIKKEVVFYIDLFRVWDMWPDEFVLGKSFVRTLKCDPVKTEYVATSFDGNILTEKRFRSFESMIRWSLSINDLKLLNIRELELGVYFVKVTVESKIRKLPPVIGYFIIFLSENEFKITKDSSFFSIGAVK
ncbi:MAG: DUF4390 domain-containing protein [Nitrospirota bacterium]